mgnify:CR=1 FL=1
MKLINADKVIETLKTRKKLFCRNQIEFRMLSPDQKSRVDEIDICIAELVNAEEVQTTDTDSDTISRAKAIEALDKRFDSIPMEQTSEILMLRKDLRELPPAQPEIIRCKDCIYSGTPDEDKWRLCYHDGAQWNEENHYCGYAERREVTT